VPVGSPDLFKWRLRALQGLPHILP